MGPVSISGAYGEVAVGHALRRRVVVAEVDGVLPGRVVGLVEQHQRQDAGADEPERAGEHGPEAPRSEGTHARQRAQPARRHSSRSTRAQPARLGGIGEVGWVESHPASVAVAPGTSG